MVTGMKKETAIVLRQEPIGTGIYSMWIRTEVAKTAKPGQFIAIYPKAGNLLLQRPISICEIGALKDELRVVYRVAGKGTDEFSGYKAGSPIEIMGPLGNGFDLSKMQGKNTAFLIGGGIGVPPMVELAKQIYTQIENGILPVDTRVVAIMGYRNSELFLNEELSKYAGLVIATEDGSVGTKGNVLDAIRANGIHGDIIFSCGPMPMLRALKQYAAEEKIPAYISLEERMACGVGACLGCVCKTTKKDEHSQVNNARVCVEGPVFDAEDVEI